MRRRGTNLLLLATVFVAAALSATACSGAQTEPEEAVAPAPAPAPPRPAMTIFRDELDETLDRGLQPLIAKVGLRPWFEKDRFVGWKIQFREPGEPPFRDSAVRPGDVLTRVNGQPVERPDQMMAVWKSLRGAEQVTFTVLRTGETKEITYAVAERSAERSE